MADIERILRQTQTIAVLWANPRESAPAHYVPAYMSAQGHRVYPVHVAPIHAGKMLWGMPMLQRLDQIHEPIDLVNVFRRAERIIDFVPDILAMDPLPKAVWFQSGLRNDAAALLLQSKGIEVVQNRCLMVDHRNLGPTQD